MEDSLVSNTSREPIRHASEREKESLGLAQSKRLILISSQAIPVYPITVSLSMSLGWPALIPRNNSPWWPVMCRNRQWNTGSRLECYRTRSPRVSSLYGCCKFGAQTDECADESIKPVHVAFPAINSIARCSTDHLSFPLFFLPLPPSAPPFIPAWDKSGIKKNLLIKRTTHVRPWPITRIGYYRAVINSVHDV